MGISGQDLQESPNFLGFFVFSFLLTAAAIWKVFADVVCGGWTPPPQPPRSERPRFGTLSGEAEGRLSMPTYMETAAGGPGGAATRSKSRR